MVDEEKNEDKQKEDHKKDNKKDFIRQSLQAAGMARESVLAVLRSEKIHPSPCIEKVAPPPNFYWSALSLQTGTITVPVFLTDQ